MKSVSGKFAPIFDVRIRALADALIPGPAVRDAPMFEDRHDDFVHSPSNRPRLKLMSKSGGCRSPWMVDPAGAGPEFDAWLLDNKSLAMGTKAETNCPRASPGTKVGTVDRISELLPPETKLDCNSPSKSLGVEAGGAGLLVAGFGVGVTTRLRPLDLVEIPHNGPGHKPSSNPRLKLTSINEERGLLVRLVGTDPGFCADGEGLFPPRSDRRGFKSIIG